MSLGDEGDNVDESDDELIHERGSNGENENAFHTGKRALQSIADDLKSSA